jgi:hypothetical protein
MLRILGKIYVGYETRSGSGYETNLNVGSGSGSEKKVSILLVPFFDPWKISL